MKMDKIVKERWLLKVKELKAELDSLVSKTYIGGTDKCDDRIVNLRYRIRKILEKVEHND